MPRTLAVLPPEQGVRLITLQRPEALNALNTELLGELAAELDAAEQDAETRVVVITGVVCPRGAGRIVAGAERRAPERARRQEEDQDAEDRGSQGESS